MEAWKPEASSTDRRSILRRRVVGLFCGLILTAAPAVVADTVGSDSDSVPLGGTMTLDFTFAAEAVGSTAVLLRASSLGPTLRDGMPVPVGGRVREVLSFPITAAEMSTAVSVPSNPLLNGRSFCLVCVVEDGGGAVSTSNALSVVVRHGQLALSGVPSDEVMGFTALASDSSSTLHAASFVDSQIGFVVGTNGTILKTEDGGSSFSEIDATHGNPINLKDVEFLDANHGFVVGYSFMGAVYRTSDGGLTWGSSLIPKKVNACDFRDSLIGYVAGQPSSLGEGGPISKTVDGGVTWSNQADGFQVELMDIRFADDATGYAVGRFGTILKTSNAGGVWSALTVPAAFNDTWFMAVEVLGDGSTAFFLGSDGVILATQDGGSNLVRVRSGVSRTLRAIEFVNDEVGFITGDRGTLLQTFDGGATWIPYDTFYDGHPNTNLVLGVEVVSEGQAFAVGYNGMLGAFGVFQVEDDR